MQKTKAYRKWCRERNIDENSHRVYAKWQNRDTIYANMTTAENPKIEVELLQSVYKYLYEQAVMNSITVRQVVEYALVEFAMNSMEVPQGYIGTLNGRKVRHNIKQQTKAVKSDEIMLSDYVDDFNEEV